MNIGYLINNCSKLLQNKLNKELEKENLTSAQFAVIKDIERNTAIDSEKSGVIAVDIATRLNMDKPTVSGIVKRLIDKGYVEKIPNPHDRRSFILKLTTKSKMKLPNLEKINNDVLFKVTKNLTEEEIQLLKKLLNKMIENLR